MSDKSPRLLFIPFPINNCRLVKVTNFFERRGLRCPTSKLCFWSENFLIQGNNFHDYLVQGVTIGDVVVYACECGKAFQKIEQARRHQTDILNRKNKIKGLTNTHISSKSLVTTQSSAVTSSSSEPKDGNLQCCSKWDRLLLVESLRLKYKIPFSMYENLSSCLGMSTEEFKTHLIVYNEIFGPIDSSVLMHLTDEVNSKANNIFCAIFDRENGKLKSIKY